MKNLCEELLDDLGARVGTPHLASRRWFAIPGGSGVNATLKIVVPRVDALGGYVLTVVRDASSPVIQREVAVLRRLHAALPATRASSVPEICAHTKCRVGEYFATRFCRSWGYQRFVRRIVRGRVWKWTRDWLADLSQYTTGEALTCTWLDAEYGDTLKRIHADPAVSPDTKRRLQEHFDLICAHAAEIPSVCCHGDMNRMNVLWQGVSAGGVVIDWGAARWPGLPCVDLCRYAEALFKSTTDIGDCMRAYCRVAQVSPEFIPALYDLYSIFRKTELDHAYANRPDAWCDPFVEGLPSDRVTAMLGSL